MIKIAYLVLVYNEIEYTKKTIQSIKKQNKDKYSFDIYLLDNASSENIRLELIDLCLKESVEYIRHNINDGYAGGNNFGFNILKNKNYDYIFIANNDIEILHPDVTSRIITIMQNDKSIAILGSKLLDSNDNQLKQSRFHSYIMKKEKLNIGNNKEVEFVPTVIGCFFCLRVSFVSDYLFDYSFFMYAEEQELEYRLMKRGYKVGILNDNDLLVKHYGGFFDFKTQNTKAVYLCIRNTILTMKIFPIFHRIKYILFYFFIILKHFFKTKRIVILKGFISGIRLLNSSEIKIQNDVFLQ